MARGNIRQRSKVRQDSWTVQVYLGLDPETGKKRYYSESVKGSKALAQKRLTEVLRELDTGNFVVSGGLKLGDYLDEWLEDWAALHTRHRTVDGYRGVVRRYLKPFLGSVEVDRLTSAHVQEMEAILLRRGGAGGRPLSGKTVSQVHRVLSSALSVAVKLGLVQVNVVSSVAAPRVEMYEASTLGWDDAQRLFAVIEDLEFRTVVVLAMLSGLRRSELAGLQWKDVDWERGVLSVRRALTKVSGVAVLNPPKNGKSRVVAIPGFGMEELTVHWERGSGLGQEDFIFGPGDGRCADPDLWSKRFKRYCGKAGLDGVRFHDLRHTHASLMLADGVHLKVVSERLGHSNVAITGDLYSHVAPSVQKDAADRLEASWRSRMAVERSGASWSVLEPGEGVPEGGNGKRMAKVPVGLSLGGGKAVFEAEISDPPRGRTENLRIKSPLLCQLS